MYLPIHTSFTYVPQGPCGEEWDDEYDGMDEIRPPWGNPRADGISLACKDSIVERNVSLS